MRIAVLVNEYPKVSHTFIRREIEALERQGFDVERLSIRPSGALVDDVDRREAQRTSVILDRGLPFLMYSMLHVAVRRPRRFARALRLAVTMGSKSDRGLLRHLAYLAEACVLVRWLESRRIEHVHAHFGTNPAAVLALARELGGPRFSFMVHGGDDVERGLGLSYDAKIERAAFVAVSSAFALERVGRWCARTSREKFHIIRCGLDQHLLDEPKTVIPETPRFACVARLVAEKGHGVLLDAVAELAAEGRAVEMTLVGDGPMRAKLERRIAALGLQDRVHLTGWASGADVRCYMLAARAIVLASLYEGIPVTLMEALALRRPVIATDVGGVSELVESGVSGWLIPPRSAEALAQALRQATEASSACLQEMGRRGSERVRQQHNVDVEAARLAALIRGVDQVTPDQGEAR